MTTKSFEPLLAKPVEWKYLDYSNLWVSKKLDGIRAIIINGVVVSRKLLPIPNRHVQRLFGDSPELEGMDGELIVGADNDPKVYSNTYSGVMSADGEPHVTFHAFDHITNPCDEYWKRKQTLFEKVNGHPRVEFVPNHPAMSEAAVLDIEQMYLDQGYEGVMLRAFQGPNSFYKYGRSTAKSCTLLKLKRFTDAEANVIGFEEQMFNGNVATKDEFGRTKRSSHAENKVGKGTLGALICLDRESGVIFNIGTGLNDREKQSIWDQRDYYQGKLLKYKSIRIGVKNAPRHPVFLGWRSNLDT